jgi:subtilisin family serine protease
MRRTSPLPFIVLVEFRSVRGLLAALLAAALLGLLCGPRDARAQAGAPGKIAIDLKRVIDTRAATRAPWANDASGTRYVKVLIVSSSADPELADLRAHVLAAGGSVYHRYVAVPALSVMLPAHRVGEIAARADVQSVSPNRPAARTASALELATGATSVRAAGVGAAAGLDGSGIGIAVLDSGVDPDHHGLRDASLQRSRVVRAVDFLRVGDFSGGRGRDWTAGVDVSAAMPLLAFDRKIAADGATGVDGYGHGSHVAGVAAGRGASPAVDSTGIAPNASLFDVKVLDDAGTGQVSDVLAGIDWVIQHARAYNIRVLNLSLASDSTESYLTDPLCRAVRSAVAAGITVVVAAGNYGQTASGAEQYGSISAPGNEPSVITVGAANTHATPRRDDDSVNFFSSRGPTRSAYTDANGLRHVDNLIKPDLVAPGNKVVSVLAAANGGGAAGDWSYLPSTYPELSAPFGGMAQPRQQQLMNLSGTSIAAPAVAGTVALMLQANPGLTPPLIKAMLQYAAQPIAGANLLQQGAGLLNVEGAVRPGRCPSRSRSSTAPA